MPPILRQFEVFPAVAQAAVALDFARVGA